METYTAQMAEVPYYNNLRMGVAEWPRPYTIYFDSSEVIDIVQGVAAFYPQGDLAFEGMDSKKLASDQSLIQALAAAGHLGGQLFMLPPHQAEFNIMLKHGMGVSDDFEKAGQISVLQKFLRDDLKLFEENIFHFRFNTEEEFRAILTDVEKDTQTVFKAVQASFMPFWRERFLHFFDTTQLFKIVDYQKETFGVEDDLIFTKLLNSWNTIRPGLSRAKNNYNDAFALLALMDKVKKFNQGDIFEIPVLYDAMGTFTKAVHEAKIENLFYLSINNPNTGDIELFPSIRSGDFFKTYALLRTGKQQKEDSYDLLLNSRLLVDDFQKKINAVQESADQQVIVQFLAIQNKEIAEMDSQIARFIEYDFLYASLLPVLDGDRIQALLDRIKTPSIIESKRMKVIQAAVEQRMRDIGQLVDRSVTIYESSFNAWTDIRQKIVTLNNTIDNQAILEFDVIRDYSLFRFFIPVEFEVELRDIFGINGVLGGDSRHRDAASIRILNKYIISIRNGNSVSHDVLYELLPSFWILGIHKYVKAIALNYENLSVPLLMLIGSCLIRDDERGYLEKNMEVVTQKLVPILKNRKKLEPEENRAKIDIALAYLYFQMYNRKGNDLFMITRRAPDLLPNSDNQIAIDCARSACQYFRSNIIAGDNENYELYATNIYLYYLTESGSDIQFENESVNRIVAEFENKKTFHEINWHFRYDDTLARYYFRRAVSLVNFDIREGLRISREAQQLLAESLLAMAGKERIRDIGEIRSFKRIVDSFVFECENKLRVI